MQDRYVADVGDFGKYGLLRRLAGMTGGNGETRMKLGVIWYLTPSCLGNPNDGKHLYYLDNQTKFKDCDEPLFCQLKKLREKITTQEDGCRVRLPEFMRTEENPNIQEAALKHIQKPEILGEAIFFDELLRADTNRADWWERARKRLKGECHLLFLDPDNGLRVQYGNEAATLLGRDESGQKHISKEEISEVLKWGASAVVIYHHLGRHGGDHDKQINLIAGALKKVAPKSTTIRAFRYHRGSSRAFFVLIRKQHKIIESRIDSFKCSSWVEKEHFQIVHLA